MDGKNLLILSIVVGLLILVGAVYYARMAAIKDQSAASAVAVSAAGVINVPASLSVCKGNDKCIIVDRSCGFCCDFVAINTRHEPLFNQMFDDACQSYTGGFCRCHDLKHYPSCVQDKCAMLEWKD